jgi:hypothetical protein
MATERITFDLPGLLSVGQVSEQKRATYLRTLKKVRLSTLGIAPSATAVKVKLRLAEVAQSAEYTLAAGLKSAENTASDVAVAASTWTDFIVSAVDTAYDLKVEAEFEVAVTVLGGSTTDLGLGTLGQLKRYILNAGVVVETTHDEALTFIGKGVAAQFDRHCNRTFKRGTSVTEDFRGDTDQLLLERYPSESVTTIGLKSAGESSFTTQTGWIDTLFERTGVLRLAGDLGTDRDIIRVTYDGGYWYDVSDDGSGTMPSGATLLPADIQAAWLTTCLHIWSKRQNLGLDHVLSDPNQRTSFTTLDWPPLVENALQPYRRLLA